MPMRGRDGDGNGVQNWRHGWIPLTPRAAMIKAKGRRGLADRLMKHHGIEDRRKGGERRAGSRPTGNDYRTPGEDRGKFRYTPGTATKDYPNRVPGSHYHPAGERSAGGSGMTAGEAFKKKGPELRKAAEAGDKNAQAELDRRAANRAAKAGGSPEAPKVERKAPEAPKVPRSAEPKTDGPTLRKTETVGGDPAPETDLPAGHRVETVGSLGRHYDENGKLLGTVKPAAFSGGFTAQDADGRGLGRTFGTRTEAHRALAEKVGKPATEPGDDGFFSTPSERVAKAVQEHGAGSYEHKTALADEDRAIAKAMAELGIGEKHRVSGHTQRNFRTGGTQVVSYHYDDASSRYRHVGIVRENDDGTWTATQVLYTDKGNEKKDKPVLGTKFPTRQDAHLSVMAHHELAKHKAEERKSKSAEKARKVADEKAAERREKAKAIVGTPGPAGTKWEVHEFPHDGTTTGATAASRVQQAYKAGRATVIIESDLDVEQTKHFLAGVTAATDRTASNLGSTNIKFYVPTKNDYMNRKNPGAFVYYGDTTVYVNPKMANGSFDATYKHSAHAGHFMPAGKEGSVLEYTLTHELGHVHDGQSRYTRPMDGSEMVWVGSGKSRSQFGKEAVAFQRSLSAGHSKYGNENPAESYAEAFAQWNLGGPGSHRVSDAYAERFNWQPPAKVSRLGDGPKKPMTEQDRRSEDAKALLRGQITPDQYRERWPDGIDGPTQEVQHTKTLARAATDIKAGDTYEPVRGNGRGSGYATKVANVEPMAGGGHRVTFTDGRSMTLADGQTLNTARVVRTETIKRRLSKVDQARQQYGNGSPQHLQALLEQQRARRRR